MCLNWLSSATSLCRCTLVQQGNDPVQELQQLMVSTPISVGHGYDPDGVSGLVGAVASAGMSNSDEIKKASDTHSLR
jgi:hypothetical protein